MSSRIGCAAPAFFFLQASIELLTVNPILSVAECYNGQGPQPSATRPPLLVIHLLQLNAPHSLASSAGQHKY